ncbi:MAG: ATP-dependent Clp protease proteolytic subunit, partial [Chloroflexi bacterium]|nr:ATP-dependent Clp protease proteolytic subunit [Chloroflexota bacterium]
MSEATGQPIDVIERDTNRDYYLDAQAAVDYGLVDQILKSPQK